jgi:hypothetical protein
MDNYLIDNIMMENFVPNEVVPNIKSVANKRLAILSFMGENRLEFTKLFDVIKSHNVYDVTHLSEVHDLLSNYLYIDKADRKKYSITSTPISLAFDVLARLPSSIWHDPLSTFLDPGCGSGIFPLVVINKLMDGLSKWECDPQKRYQHIVENMIYVSDIYSRYIFQFQCLVDPHGQYKLNTYCGSSVDDVFQNHITNKWGISKFTAIIGMPPYSYTKYIPFINNFINSGDYMAYIVPSKITINVFETKHLVSMKKNGLSHVTFLEDGIFDNSVSFMFFGVDHTHKHKLINVNDVAYLDISEPLHNYKSKLEHSIIVKISNLWKLTLERGSNETIPYGSEVDDVNVKLSPSREYPVKMLSRLGGGKELEYHFIKEDKIKEDKNKGVDKLVFPRASGNYSSAISHRKTERDFVYNTLMSKDIAVSRSIMYITVKNREEA